MIHELSASIQGARVDNDIILTPKGMLSCTLTGQIWLHTDSADLLLGNMNDGVNAIVAAYEGAS